MRKAMGLRAFWRCAFRCSNGPGNPAFSGAAGRRRVAVPCAWGAGRPPTSISSCARYRGGQAPDQGRLPQARRAKRGHPPCDVLRALRHSDLRSRLRRHCNAGGRASLGGRGSAPHPAAGCLGTLRSPCGDALRLMAPPRPSPPGGSGAQAGRLRPAFGGPPRWPRLSFEVNIHLASAHPLRQSSIISYDCCSWLCQWVARSSYRIRFLIAWLCLRKRSLVHLKSNT